ncbi:MAG TPA: sigma-70 family RNA polymerase sigma factor [Gemmataceae bacterium]|nr:sigma-70 family RNA polymerase sigma factor [Gemmataceae bacterium]
MTTKALNGTLRRLRRASLLQDGGGLGDGELLECYVTDRDEAAFAALLRRHGPMVLGVCRRVLRHEADAEDAFQATFLVLVRKAHTVVPRGMVSNWLYGVAHNTARKAKAMARKRRSKEAEAGSARKVVVVEGAWREVQELLDEELSRLPDRYRVPIVLCELEGKTIKEVARQLGWPQGTVATRLSRGRVMLGKRLARHGLPLAGAGMTAALAEAVASAGVPAPLERSTVQAASRFAAGRAAAGLVSATAAALTDGVLKSMLLHKLKIATAVLAGLALVLGLAARGPRALAQRGAERPAAKPAANPPAAEAPAKPRWRGKVVMTREHPVTLLTCTAGWVAVGDEGGNLFLWDAAAGKERVLVRGGKKQGYTSSVDRLQFTADGKHLYAITNGRRAIFRSNFRDAKGRAGGLMAPNPTFLGVTADADVWLETHVANRTLALRPNPFKPGGTAEFESIRYEADITHAVSSADDKWLAVVTADGKLHLHERDSLRKVHTLPTEQRTVAGVQFSPDGKRVAVVGHDAPPKVFDVAVGKEVATLKGHRGIVFAVAFSPDGKWLVTGGDDTTARVWDAATGKPLAVLDGHKDSVRAVGFDPDSGALVTGSADKTVKVWKLTR